MDAKSDPSLNRERKILPAAKSVVATKQLTGYLVAPQELTKNAMRDEGPTKRFLSENDPKRRHWSVERSITQNKRPE
ncbi:MAG: hypothetical protein ACLQU3_04445 [Limisphaerales bacterium]